jgi:hypothetical protein
LEQFFPVGGRKNLKLLKKRIVKNAPIFTFLLVWEKFGKTGGTDWTDVEAFNVYGTVTAIKVFAGDGIDAIQFKYGDTWGVKHGGSGGDGVGQLFELATGETIVQIKGNLLVFKEKNSPKNSPKMSMPNVTSMKTFMLQIAMSRRPIAKLKIKKLKLKLKKKKLCKINLINLIKIY